MGLGSGVGEVDPDEAWKILNSDETARLIDVRTHAEWSFVGVPDTREIGTAPIFVEWSSYPNMSVNPAFAAEVENATGSENPGTLLFICRSGARSLQAAMAVTDHFARMGVSVTCSIRAAIASVTREGQQKAGLVCTKSATSGWCFLM